MPPRRRRTEPRKRPRQSRAQVTVDSILVAAERLLRAGGLQGFTTAKVAELAGVSVGTLYQYFPSKEAIIAVLIERHNLDVLQLFAALLDGARGVPLRDGVRIASRGLMDHFRAGRAALHAALTEARPAAGRTPAFQAHLAALVDLLAAYFTERRAELRVDDPRTAAYLLVHSADGVTQAMSRAVPSPAEAERIVEETCDMVTRYLIDGVS